MSQSRPQHVPVLLAAEPGEPSPIMDILQPKPGETVLDATLGLGGHSAAFLQAIEPSGTLIGMDADTENLAIARERLQAWGTRVTFVHSNFRNLPAVASPVDILFADLGLSSPHVDDATRGFTFRESAPFDLRYDRTTGETAADMLTRLSEQELTSILRTYADVDRSRALARELLAEAAQHGALMRTEHARAGVERVFGYRAPSVLPQVFQALRVLVNDEAEALHSFLEAVPHFLKPGGRCGIISYHSLEDRMVKQAFRTMSTPEKDPHTGQISVAAPFALLTRKPVVPDEREIHRNPRARSAKFRAIRRMPLELS